MYAFHFDNSAGDFILIVFMPSDTMYVITTIQSITYWYTLCQISTRLDLKNVIVVVMYNFIFLLVVLLLCSFKRD